MKSSTTKAGLLSALLFVSVGAFGVAGCTPSAREDVSNAGSDLGSATKKSADATKDVVASAGQSVEKGAVDAGKDIKKSADNAATATDKAAKDAGASIKNGTNAAVQGTEKAAADAGAALSKGTQTFTLTPKVKSAILADDGVKVTDLNIDTHSDSKQIIVNGTVSSEALKAKAMADAKKAMADDTSGYTLVDNLKVAK